jgi:tRNA(His) 5'-end guanylyltransferase
MSEDSLGDRMKSYEDASRIYLPRRLPVIIRLDGKAFHTWTRGLPRPYCQSLMAAMNEVAKHLCSQVQNTVLAYTQSDEISLLLVDYQDIKTTSWFDSNLQKMASVSAGIASAKLTALSPTIFGGLRDSVKEAVFDARVFVLPPHEVNNYFIWRQQDWNRNSLAMLAQSMFSHKELQGKGRAEQHEICFQKGVNWANLSSHIKDGRVVVKREVEKFVATYNTRAVAKITDPVEGQVEGGFKFTAGAWEPLPVIRREWHVPEETPVFVDSPFFVNGLITP